MGTPEATPDPLADPRVFQALQDYQAAVDAGQRQDHAEFAARYPEVAGPLAGCLRGFDLVRAGASPEPSHNPPAPAGSLATESRLGDFRIVREVGRGGMGVVYEAEQLSLGRRVALKVLTAPAPDDRARQRFRNEAHAVASLNHPHVVPVHAIGAEGDALFLAMRFVDGRSLAALVRQVQESSGLSKAPTRQPTETATDAPAPVALDTAGQPLPFAPPPAAEYYRAVARFTADAAGAIQHAHECGIVHRDIKPGNLLLEPDGHVWVADFGLARGPDAAELTRTGEMLGTLRYMSPEQARGAAVDYRTDVYSLGVTLYEVLTLRAAFPGGDPHDVLRRVGAEEPPAPRRLAPAVPRDLEIVVLKAMAKEPAERYATAREFADDLQRFLDGRPILARPAGRLRRTTKWVRRNPGTAALLAAILLTLLTGLAGVTWKWREAAAQRNAAENATVAADRERAEAERNFQDAERNFQDAFRAVNDYFTRVSEHRLLDEPGLQPLRKELLEDALKYYQQFLARRGHDPKLRLAVAQTYIRIGHINLMIEAKNRSLEAYQNALPLLESLAREAPDDVEVRLARGECDYQIANLHAEAGRLEDALRQYGRARETQEGLVRDRPTERPFRIHLARTWAAVGVLHARTGKAGEARQAYEQALTLLARLAEENPRDPSTRLELAKSRTGLGLLSNRPGQHATALEELDRARGIAQQLADEHPQVGQYRWSLALTYNHIAAVQRNAGRTGEALESCRKATALYERLANENPTTRQYQYGLSESYGSAGILHYMARRLDAAKESFERERTILEPLTAAYPEHLDYHSALAGSWSNFGLTLGRLGRHEDARTAYEAAVTSQRKAFDAAPQIFKYRDFLNKQYRNLARCLGELKRPGDAVTATLERRTLWPADPARLYEVACDLALSAGQQDGDGRERTAALAVETLRQASAAGFKDVRKLQTDPALASLRDRNDFRQLLTPSK